MGERTTGPGDIEATRRALLERLLRDGSTRPGVAPGREPGHGEAPASSAQRRLWFLDRHQAAGAAYHVPAVFRLAGPLDVEALRRAIAAVVRRHDALRTTFAERDGEVWQVVSADVHVPLRVVDLGPLPAAERGPSLARMVAAEAQPPFDLGAGPLLRTTLFRLGAAEHRLFVDLHHIIVDGWSLGLVVREVAAACRAFADGGDWRPPGPPVQYPDVARRQLARLRDGGLDGQLGYWLRRLADLPALELPTDRPRPAVPTWRGARRRFDVPAEVAGPLSALGARAGASPFVVLLAAFLLLLHRHTGQTDLVVGTPVANRTTAELEQVAGLLANVLAIRVDVAGDPTFRELLDRARTAVLEAFANQDVPFEVLVERLRPERDAGRHPVFQVVLGQDVPAGLAGLPGPPRWSALDMTGQLAKFDVTVTHGERDGGFAVGVEYATDLFEHDTMARFAGHLRTVLAGIAADPDRRLSRVPLLTAEERAWLGRAAGPDRVDVGERLVHELVARRVAEAPDATAVSEHGRVTTYRELDRRANHLAGRLREAGAGPEAPIAVLLPRSADLVVAALAVARSGAAYVPADPGLPAGRIAALLANVGARAVVTGAESWRRLHRLGPPAIVLGPGQEADHGPAVPLSASSLAYVIHTSGSTGVPRGVAVEHRALRNAVHWALSRLALDGRQRVLLGFNPGFDGSLLELWAALVAGAALHVAPDRVVAEPAELVRWLTAERVTGAVLATPLAEAVLAEPWPPEAALRVLVTGGDTLRRGPDPAHPFELVNAYGPTEAGILATAAAVTPGQTCPPIGRPIPNAAVHVLDAGGGRAPAGVTGDLHIGGAGVARGYLGDPRATADRFVPDPFGDEPGARLYRTGDRARWRADGRLDFAGRDDLQVKIRGFRIEPGEVEQVLRRHPRVADVVVVVRGSAPDQALVATVVPAGPHEPPTADELRGHARGALPSYAVPSVFERLDRLPLTSSGKVDRRRLAAAAGVPLPMAARPAPRATGTEGRIAAVWREVLGVDGFGIDDNFFDLGGHSFAALRVRQRLAEALGREISVVDLFQHPTVGALAEHLDAAAPAAFARGTADGAGRGRLRRAAMGRRRPRP